MILKVPEVVDVDCFNNDYSLLYVYHNELCHVTTSAIYVYKIEAIRHLMIDQTMSIECY